MIQKYEYHEDWGMVNKPNGEYIKLSDVVELLERMKNDDFIKDNQIATLELAISFIKE